MLAGLRTLIPPLTAVSVRLGFSPPLFAVGGGQKLWTFGYSPAERVVTDCIDL
jgi:hypothetical protein